MRDRAGETKAKRDRNRLYSVKERIAIYTGYQNSVRVLSKQGAGTIVIITVPKISVKDKNNQ